MLGEFGISIIASRAPSSVLLCSRLRRSLLQPSFASSSSSLRFDFRYHVVSLGQSDRSLCQSQLWDRRRLILCPARATTDQQVNYKNKVVHLGVATFHVNLRNVSLTSCGKKNHTDKVKCQLSGDDVVDSKILPYCSIDKKTNKKSLGELEQEFLQALQAFYYENKAIMSNEEFDNLKEELMWEGSSVVMLSSDEQKFLEASMAFVAGKPILTDAEFDELKLRLKMEGSEIVQEGPRCSLRSRKVYSDLSVDYFKMFLLNVPAAVVALTLFFFLDDITGFEITYIMELPEPFSFIFTWFAALPLIFWIAQAITNAIVKDFLILKGPCPNCGTENVSFFGTILSIPSGGIKNNLKCSNCGTGLIYDSTTRLITLPEGSEA